MSDDTLKNVKAIAAARIRARLDAQDSDAAQKTQAIHYGIEAATEQYQDVVVVKMPAGGYVWLIAREYESFMPGTVLITVRPGPTLSDAELWKLGGWRGGPDGAGFYTNDGRKWRWSTTLQAWVNYSLDLARPVSVRPDSGPVQS